jgi:hypothetical protein
VEDGKVFICLYDILCNMANIISKRIAPILWGRGVNNTFGSLRVTITQELLDIGIDPENDDLEKAVSVQLIEDKDGKKRIVIEKIEGR